MPNMRIKLIHRVEENQKQEYEVRYPKPADQQHLYFQGKSEADCDQNR